MKKNMQKMLCLFLAIWMCLGAAGVLAEDIKPTPFEKHGKLRVEGAYLLDQNGEKYQLFGMSTHGIAWYPQYVNRQTFTALRDEWNNNCVRIAMYTHEYGGYCSGGDQEKLKTIVKNGVEYATELGMYVIIDWHVLNEKTPLKYKDEALKFFEEMSSLYAGQDNVIYEICNEPNGTSWAAVKTYANEVIPVIRANDPDAIIIVGSSTWSQDVHVVQMDPLEYDNLLYALHFYAGTHKDYLRDRMKTCIKLGLPIIVSEFGICDASGNGKLDYESGEAWKKLIEEYNVSFFCWNLANKGESSSIFKPLSIARSGWTDDDLSDQGKWIRDWFLTKTNP